MMNVPLSSARLTAAGLDGSVGSGRRSCRRPTNCSCSRPTSASCWSGASNRVARWQSEAFPRPEQRRRSSSSSIRTGRCCSLSRDTRVTPRRPRLTRLPSAGRDRRQDGAHGLYPGVWSGSDPLWSWFDIGDPEVPDPTGGS